MSMHFFMEFVNKATGLRLSIPKSKVKMNVCSIWSFAQISDDFYYYLDIWQCARYFVAALFKELAVITIREMWGLGLELPGLGLGFYDKVSVSSRNLSQVSVSEVTVSTTSLQFVTAKIYLNALKQGSWTHSALRQRSSQLQKYKVAHCNNGVKHIQL